MSVRREISARVLLEAPDAVALANLSRYGTRTIKSSCDNVRNGAIVITLYDEDGNLLGSSVSGTPSQELEADVEELYDGANKKAV